MQGKLSGNCGTLSSVNGVQSYNDVNGRGTATIGFNNPCTDPNKPCDTFAYYVMARDQLVFVDMTAPGATLSGVAHETGLSSTSKLSTLGCGTLIEVGQIPNCVMFTSGAQGGSATLTIGRFTCAPAAEGSCKENISAVTGQLTGQFSATFDQIAAGNLNNPGLNPCPTATAANPMPPVCLYNISPTTGMGYICLDSSNPACPNGATDSHALTYADGFLLANDTSAAVGSMKQQLFFCTTPCSPGPQPFENNKPGQFAGVTISPSLSVAPDIAGVFTLTAPAAACPGPDNFDSEALFASGPTPNPFSLSIPPAPSIKGCFGLDSATPTTGRGSGSSTVPGPADFIFYEVSPGQLIVMQTDNNVPGGQVLLNLTFQSAPLMITSASSTGFTVAGQGTFTVTAGGGGGSTPTTPPTAVPLMAASLPNGITFTDNGNGTATISKAAGAGVHGTYSFVIDAQDKSSTAIPGCSPQGTDACQLFVLDIQ